MKRVIVSLSLVASLSIFGYADGAKKDTKLSDTEKQEMMQSEFEMPSPGALVSSLNKSLGKINWSSFIEPVGNKKYTSNEDMVLNLGARGADAYFLTSGEDSSNLISVSTEINYLLNKIKLNGKSLNSNRRKAKLKTIKDFVNAKNWKSVLKEINLLQNNIDTDFIDAKVEKLKILNNVGGWLEGYRLAVEGFEKNYKADKTGILVQDELISYLIKQINNNAELKSFSKTSKLLKTFNDINAVLKGAKNYQLTKEQVDKLRTILNETKKYI